MARRDVTAAGGHPFNVAVPPRFAITKTVMPISEQGEAFRR